MSSLSRLRSFILLAGTLILPWTAARPAAAQQTIPVDSLPNETPAHFTPVDSSFDYVRRDVMIPMRDGVKLHTVILVPKGAKDAPILMTRTPYDASSQVSYAYTSHNGAAAQRLRQRARRDPAGRLHPGHPGHPRQVRLRGRVRDEPPLRRTAQSHEGRRVHRHVGHDRLAGQARARVEREGRDPGDLLRRIHEPHAAREPAPRPQGRGADEPDGGRLDGGRLVPPRRLPRAEHALHPRAGGLADQRVSLVDQRLGRLRPVHERGLGRPAREGARPRAGRLLAEDRPASRLRPLVAAPGHGLDPGQAAPEGPRDAGPQPVGPGGHLRRPGRVPRPGAQGHEQRHGLPGHGPLASRAGDRERELAGGAPVQQQHVTLLPAPHPGALPGPLPEGRLAPRQRGAGHGLPHGSGPLGAAAVVALGVRDPAAR